jgi:hypothetical protein
MEVSVGDYGRMMFEMMVAEKYSDLPEHWQSIKKEAEPLVRKLLALNNKMSNGGYKIHGYVEKKGKKKVKVLSDHEKINIAQAQLAVDAGTLQEGDYFWLYKHYDHEMYIGQDDPLSVTEVTKKAVYFEMSHCGGHHTESIALNDKVLKAPDFYKEYDETCSRLHNGTITHEEFNRLQKEHYAKEDEFTSDAYWLKKYEELHKE